MKHLNFKEIDSLELNNGWHMAGGFIVGAGGALLLGAALT